MNINKLLSLYNKRNIRKSGIRYQYIISRLMGRYIVNRIDKKTMLMLLYKLDYMEYEYGYAVAKDSLIREAIEYRNKKINLRKQYHLTSSTLFKILEGERVAISSALEFSKVNNYNFSDNFIIYSKKKTYSKELKKDIKCAIRGLLDYAVEIGIIKENPMPKKHIFKIDERRPRCFIPDNAIKDYVNALFQRSNINERCYSAIFILVGLDRSIAMNLKINNFNFEKHYISFKDKKYYMSEYLSNMLEEYFIFENQDNNIIDYNKNYLKTVIYKIGNDVSHEMFNLETLRANYSILIQYLNEYKDNNQTNHYKSITKQNDVNYNDFKEFLKLKKEYLG